MRHSLFSAFFLTILGALTLSSCSKGPIDNVSLVPVKLEDGKWSFVDKNGKIVLEDEFENMPSVVYNNVFSVMEDDGYSVYTLENNRLFVLGDLEGLASVGYMEDGLIPAAKEGQRIAVYNSNGHKKFDINAVNGKEVSAVASGYSEGMLPFTTEDGKWGYFDENGNVAIKPAYDWVGSFSEGLAVVMKKSVNDPEKLLYSVIDKKGETVFRMKDKLRPADSYAGTHFTNGCIIAVDDNHSYLYDKKGELSKLGGKIKRALLTDGKYVIFIDDKDKWGVSRTDGEIVIRPKYDFIIFSNLDPYNVSAPGGADGFICMNGDSGFVLLDKNGDQKEKFDEARNMIPFGGFGFFVRDDKNWSQVDKNANLICGDDFEKINTDRCAYPLVQSDRVDYSDIVDEIADMITETGIKPYQLGSSPEALFAGESPNDYAESYNYGELKYLNTHGTDYSTSGSGYFSAPITDYYYNTDISSYGYKWNSGSRLTQILLEVSVPNKKWGAKGNDALAKELETRGFTIVKKGSFENQPMILLENVLSTGIILRATYNGFAISVTSLSDDAKRIEFETLMSSIIPTASQSETNEYDYLEEAVSTEEALNPVNTNDSARATDYYDSYNYEGLVSETPKQADKATDRTENNQGTNNSNRANQNKGTNSSTGTNSSGRKSSSDYEYKYEYEYEYDYDEPGITI